MIWQLSLVLKATVVLGAALLVVRLCHRTRASRRHVILASALIALAWLPVMPSLVPTVTVAMPAPVALTGLRAFVPSPKAGVRLAPAAPPATTARPAVSGRGPSLVMILQTIWLIGVLSCVCALAASLWRLHRQRHAAVRWPAGQTLADTLANDAGMHRRAEVAIHARASVPGTIGAVRPIILLPPDAIHWAETDLERVLIHELEHVRRGDWWTHLLARLVCIAYWFHPLAWIAWRHLGVLAERACDDAVVIRADRSDYAEQLIAFAGRMSRTPAVMLSMARPSALSVRVRAILDATQPRGRAGAATGALIAAAAALLVSSIASLQAVGPLHPRKDAPAAPGPAVSSFVGEAGSSLAKATPQPDAYPAHIAARQADAVKPFASPITRGRPARFGQDGANVLINHLSADVSAMPAGDVSIQRLSLDVSSSPADTPAGPYVIGSDDVLVITVMEQRALSEEAVVRPDGKISMPLVNEMQAAGLTPEQLRRALTAALGSFVTNPVVTVAVKEIRSRNVFVIGEVSRPGMYQLTNGMTVLQALAVAGGLTRFARSRDIAIVRKANGSTVSIPFDFAEVRLGHRLEQNVVLVPGDTIMVR